MNSLGLLAQNVIPRKQIIVYSNRFFYHDKKSYCKKKICIDIYVYFFIQLGTWILDPIVSGIPDSLSCIPDS